MAPETGRDDWPAGPWRLTAPESYVLRHGPRASGTEAFKLVLMELVARGVLRLAREERGGLFGGEPAPAPARGAGGGRPDSAVLEAVHGLYRAQAAKTAGPFVPIKDLARAAGSQWGGLGNFTGRVVLPALATRGLYRREEYRILWLFPASRFVPTPDGEAVRADLERLLRIGREEAGGWTGPRAGQALAFAGLAGGAVLLLQPIPPELRDLRRERQDGDGGAPAASGDDGGGGDDERPAEPEPGEPPAGEFGDLPTDLSFDLDLGAFDAFDGIDSAFATVDAGVDSGGGGGDGGGGDGGGGGGGGGE